MFHVITALSVAPATCHALLWAFLLLSIDYVGVLAAIVIDFRSGTLRAKRLRIPRTSRGYRRSVDKASRYFITLLSLSVIDAMLMVAVLLLRATAGWAIPVVPVLTTIGAICLTLIEVKSVMENSQNRSDFTSTAQSIIDILEDERVRRIIEEWKKIKDVK